MATLTTALRVLAVAAAACAVPSLSFAQGSSPAGSPRAAAQAAAPQGGPMVLEQVQTRYFIAPEWKVSRFDDVSAQFLGGYGGVMFTDAIMVGAGLYTLMNGSDGRGMTYGGGVVGWQPVGGDRLALHLRSLVGFGQGTLTQAVTFGGRNRRDLFQGTRRLSNDFFVAEPQVEMAVRLTSHLHVDLGAGYRFVGSTFDDNRFSGASGSIALRIGSAK